MQVGDREARQARLGLGALAGGAFVADLAASAGGCPRMRRDGGRMVMGLDLHQHMRRFLARAVLRGVGVALRQPALDLPTLHHRGIVGIGHDGVLRRELVRVADHLEHRAVLLDAVDRERRVEDLVAAVFAVGLGEHHQFHVGGIALQLGERAHQVVDLVVRQGQAEVAVGRLQRRPAVAQHVHMLHRLGRPLVEQVGGALALEDRAFCHAVVQQVGHGLPLCPFEPPRAAEQAALEDDAIFGHPLHPLDGCAAVVRDVGRLRGPGRDGAQARRHDHQLALDRAGVRVSVVQQGLQLVACLARQRLLRPYPVHMARMHRGDARIDRLQPGQQGLRTETGQGVAALEVLEMFGGSGHAWGSRWRDGGSGLQRVDEACGQAHETDDFNGAMR